MKRIHGFLSLLIALQLCSPAWSSGLHTIPDHNLAQFVIEHLDLGTFASSISSHLQASKSSFSDYGFVPEHIWEKEAILEDQTGNRLFDIRVLRHDRGSITVCVHDFSQSGRHFDRESILLLHPEPNSDRLGASRSSWAVDQ